MDQTTGRGNTTLGGGVLGGKSLDGSQRQRLLSVAHASRLSNISQVRRRPLARGVQGVEDRKDNLCFLGIQYNKISYCTEYLRTVLELVTDSVVPCSDVPSYCT
jgi:hypothetical protein